MDRPRSVASMRAEILRVGAAHEWDKERTAAALGISLWVLNSRIRRFNVPWISRGRKRGPAVLSGYYVLGLSGFYRRADSPKPGKAIANGATGPIFPAMETTGTESMDVGPADDAENKLVNTTVKLRRGEMGDLKKLAFDLQIPIYRLVTQAVREFMTNHRGERA